jgi:hypothetical protein
MGLFISKLQAIGRKIRRVQSSLQQTASTSKENVTTIAISKLGNSTMKK